MFSNKAETWAFVSHCRNVQPDGTLGPYVEAHSWIEVIPQADGSTTWHYTKDQTCAYWNPGIVQAELYFNLQLTKDGSWYSTGGRIIMPQGCPWAVPWCAGPVDVTYTVPSDPGKPRPYLILADSGVTDITTYPNPEPGTLWQTLMYVEDGMLVSDQREGTCLHEKWYFSGQGLVKVVPLDAGDCKGLDPKLAMERIHAN